jgi:hypothetical protein
LDNPIERKKKLEDEFLKNQMVNDKIETNQLKRDKNTKQTRENLLNLV